MRRNNYQNIYMYRCMRYVGMWYVAMWHVRFVYIRIQSKDKKLVLR